jgi:hypothetical protein
MDDIDALAIAFAFGLLFCAILLVVDATLTEREKRSDSYDGIAQTTWKQRLAEWKQQLEEQEQP